MSLLNLPLQDHTSSKPGEFLDAYAALWAKLTGIKIGKPRKYSAKNSYAKENGVELDRRTDLAQSKGPVNRKGHKTKRVVIWQAELDGMWKSLGAAGQAAWEKGSVDAFEEEKVEWKRKLAAPVSKKPEDRQKCVDSLYLRYCRR